MLGDSSRIGKLRLLAVALLAAGSLAIAAGLPARAAENTIAPSGPADPAQSGQPAPPSGEPAPAPPVNASTAPPAADGVTVEATPSPAPRTDLSLAKATASGSKSVSIIDYAFKPGSITVHTGDNVVWTNDGHVPEGHNVEGEDLHSGTLQSGDSYSHTFNQAGSFSYVCTIHPKMKGTVKVLGRSAGSSQGSAGSAGSGGSGSSVDQSAGANAVPAPTQSSTVAPASSTAGSSGSLPATGEDALWLASIGLLLLNLGVAVRVVGAEVVLRRG
jgi:plastocyanin